MMVRHSKRGNRECRGITGPCEDKVKLVPCPVGGWRGEEGERVYLPGHTPAPDCVRLQLQIQNQHSPPVYFHSMCAKS